MRQYRGLTKDGKWVYGWHCQVEEKHFILTDECRLDYEENYNVFFGGIVEVIPEIVEQYTGLKDKNGVELDWYAGDIIQKGEIIRAITVDWEHGMRFMLGKHILCRQDGINGTKVGNIHENPSLSEKQV